MPRFRKKPVVIEAKRMENVFSVSTLDGTMIGQAGDWLITGIEGEKYPCADGIFRQTYDPCEDDEEAMRMFAD